MNFLESLTWLTGFSRRGIPEDAALKFTLEHPIHSWGVFVYLAIVAVLAYFVFFLYRLEHQSAPGKIKALLIGLRLSVILLLAMIFLGPAITYDEERSLAPFVVVLRDASSSMGIVDLYQNDDDAQRVSSVAGRSADEISRSELSDLVFTRNDSEILKYLNENSNLKVFDFSSDIDSATWIGGDDDTEQQSELAPLVPRGLGSNYYKALSKAMSFDPLAAIVLLGDGQHTQPSLNPLDMVDPLLAGDVPPVYVVGVGDPTPPRDARISEVRVDDVAYPGNPFPVEFVLHTSGIDEDSLSVELLEFEMNNNEIVGEGRVIETKEFSLTDADTLQFVHTKHEPGSFAYSVRVEQVENERDIENNQFQTPAKVTVRDDEIKVLLIAGSPTREYRFVSQLLINDPSIDLSCWLQTLSTNRPQEGNGQPLTRLPKTKDEMNEYSAIMLFDPNHGEFSKEWMELLKEFVKDRSGGVLYMAGSKFSGYFMMSPDTKAISNMLPVRFNDTDVGISDIGTRTGVNNRSSDMRLVEKHMDEPIMAFFPEGERNLAIWDQLPGPYWSFPAYEAKPSTRTLLEQSDPLDRRNTRPLLVTGRYGSGRTVYFGFNSVWRWRNPLDIPDAHGNIQKINGQNLYQRLWLQTVGYLIEGRLQEGKSQGWVRTDLDRYDVGDQIIVTAQLYDASQEPLKLPGDQLEAYLIMPDGTKTPIDLNEISNDNAESDRNDNAKSNETGLYETLLFARQTGSFEIEIHLPSTLDGGDTLDRPIVKGEYVVSLPEIEFNQPELNKSLLQEICDQSGGAYLDIDNYDQLKDLIDVQRQTIIVPGSPHALWDTANILLLAVGLLSVEWLVRKAYKLL